MPVPYGPFTVAAGALAPIETGQYPNAAKAVVINESPFTLTVDPGTGNLFIISPFMQDMINLSGIGGYSGVLRIKANADLSFGGTPPISVLYVLTYTKDEQVPNVYPAALPRLMSVGNTVQTGVQVSSIDNSGEATPTNDIFDQPTGYTSPAILLINTAELHLTPKGNGTQADALAVIPGAGSGVYAVVQMDAANIVTDGLGGLKQTKALGGVDTDMQQYFPSDSPTVQASLRFFLPLHDIGWYDENNNAAIIQGNGSRGIKALGSGQYLGPWSRFTGTTTGTYNHGLGATPNHVMPMQSAVGSQTMGYDTPGATTVHITSGAGSAFTAMAVHMTS